MEGITFKLILEDNWFAKDEVFQIGHEKLIVVNEPKRKWYKLVIQFLSFTWYKAPWEYEVKLFKT